MRKIKCIVIDDEIEAVNRFVSLLLKLENIEILYESTNSQTVINEILNRKPDLVFVDVEMPNKSGFDVVDEIRSKEFFPTFVFVTAYNQYAIAAIKKAAFDYLLKPVCIDELKLLIDRYCSESAYHKIVDISKSPICKNLSEREKEVLLLVIEVNSSDSIAQKLFISRATVDFHRKNILSKTETKTFAELVSKLNQIEYIV